MSNSNGSQVPKRIFRSLSIPSQSSAPTQSSTTRSILLRNDSIENDLEKLEQQYAKKVIEVIRRERSLTMGRHASLSQSMPLERNIRESVFPIPENELEESSGSIVSAPPACEEHEVRSHSIGGVERRGLDRSVLSFNVRDDTRLRILENERHDLEAKLVGVIIENGLHMQHHPRFTLRDMLTRSFWKDPNAIENALETFFKIKERGTTAKSECICGLIHFMACVYIVPVLPQVMAIAGYDPVKVVQITAAMLALANTVSAFVTNLPFILSPSVPISLFIAIYLFDNKGTVHDGSVATIWSGVLLCILGSKPFAIIFLRLVPYCLQASLTSAIGILVALSGTTEIHWVVAGKHSLLDMGELTPAIYIGLGTIILMGTVFHYKIKGAFVIGLIFGSVVYWAYANAWPQQIASVPSSIRELQIFDFNSVSLPLTFASFGLLFTLLVGLTRSYSDLAHLTDENDHVPRGRLIFVLCGLFTIVSGLNSGLPIALSSEVAVGLKDGAKTGLSTLIAAFCYFLLIFIGPLFAAIPPSGTFPLLFLIGVFLLPNLRKVDWSVMNDALPAFFIIFVVPFTQNLLRGMLFGFIVYGILAVLSGQMKDYIYIYFHEVKHEMRLLFCAKDEERTSNADSDEPPPQRQSQENSEPPAAAHNNSAADIQIPRDLFVGDLSSESMAMRH